MILLAPVLPALTPQSLSPPKLMSIGYCHMMGGLSIIGDDVIALQFQVSDFVG